MVVPVQPAGMEMCWSVSDDESVIRHVTRICDQGVYEKPHERAFHLEKSLLPARIDNVLVQHLSTVFGKPVGKTGGRDSNEIAFNVQ
jgi:hypothetical protein